MKRHQASRMQSDSSDFTQPLGRLFARANSRKPTYASLTYKIVTNVFSGVYSAKRVKLSLPQTVFSTKQLGQVCTCFASHPTLKITCAYTRAPVGQNDYCCRPRIQANQSCCTLC
ncbi:unnamed protein product, partial [Ectocarpus sp. 8 AP-2014]